MARPYEWDKVRQGLNPKMLSYYATISGYDSSITGIAKAFGLTYQKMHTRLKKPSVITKKEMDKFIANTHLNSYEIVKCFFADSLDTIDERAYYADLYLKMGEWLKSDMGVPGDPLLEKINVLTDTIKKQSEEIEKLKDKINDK